MPRASTPPLHPALLPPGTGVGPWRVTGWAGSGVHGAVYRAVPVDTSRELTVALKVAMAPRDPRFAREVALLSRTHHPSVPRLIDAGDWQHPSGTRYPYVAMQWVDGVPLYDWARQQPPSCPQVLRLLAQLASALQELHAQGGLHRDVKGDNILVRHSDSRAFLTDFGSSIYPGAATLTPPTLYPGTPAYRSPESWLFDLQFSRNLTARYGAGPADDVYALGVTSCRLVTGEYPHLADPSMDENGHWRMADVRPPPALLRTEPLLRAIVLRMLSVRPEERCTTAELIEALDQALPSPEPSSHHPRDEAAALTFNPRELAAPPEVQAQLPEESARARGSAERVAPRAHMRHWRPWLSLTAAGLALAIWAWWVSPGQPVEEPAFARAEAPGIGQKDAGTTGLGEAAAIASKESSPGVAIREVMAEDTLPEPQPEQARPDAKGRCPHKRQVAINGGCWAAFRLDRAECEESGGYVIKTTCYVPILPAKRRPPTSSPTDRR